MIEVIGVLAIVTIMAGVLIPAVLKRVDRGYLAKEITDLNAISNALVLQVLRSNTIPSEADWGAAVANWTMRPASQISTNDQGFPRLFFYDQGGWLNGNLPYAQGQTGTRAVIPSGGRIAIVSSIARALPFTNGAISSANFDSLWNATQGTVPRYLSGLGWRGNADDLVIQRIPVDPLFHHIILSSRDPSAGAGYSINSTNLIDRAAVPTNTYYLDGSIVALWVGNILTNRFVLTSDTSLIFEAGIWRNQLSGDGTDNSITAQNFTIQAQIFIGTAGIPGSHQGADTQGALSAFYSFMYAYTIWANKCPHFQFSGNNGTAAVDYQILNALGQNGSGGIINGATGSGGGGLLQ